MRSDEGVFRVGDGIIFLGEVSDADAELEIQLITFAFQTVERHVGDECECASKFRLIADARIEETQADSRIIRFRLP